MTEPMSPGSWTRRDAVGLAGMAAASGPLAPGKPAGLEDKRHAGTIDRLYVLHAGYAIAPDRSVYTPGKWKGQQIALSCNAYLIHRAGEWIMWDTGIEDALAEQPGGQIIAHDIRGIVLRTIRQQLAELDLTPGDITTVILSHAHFDHVGNASLFPHATWYIQRREHEAMFGPGYEQYGYAPQLYADLEQAKVELLDGDADLFGDGSLRVIATPGHTPGHCSLLVRLAQAGPILLTADVVHDRFNMEHRLVPSMNSDAEESRNSMECVAALVRDQDAQLWINHDIAQNATIPHAPAFFN